MNRRLPAVLALGVMLLLAGCAVGFQDEAPAPEPADPPTNDSLGYYDGYWYNDTFDIDPSTGLTDAEKEAVVSRAMARVQLLRGLEFDDRVDVELITREEFRDRYGGIGERNASADASALDNAQYEALFLVGPDEDVADVRRANAGENILGFYSPAEERIVIVSTSDPATLDGELTLAHELLHALQDQRFGLMSLDGNTTDAVNARNGLVEGDAVFIERQYERNCETGEWQCVRVGDGPGAATPGDEFHFGVYFVGFFPYAEGPSFIDYHVGDDWDAVDAMYDDQPRYAAEIIHPETYGSDVYGDVDLEDRSADDWERVEPSDGPAHAVVGQSGLASMFAYTIYDEFNSSRVIEPDEFINRDAGGELDPDRPFTYDVSYADGWSGDRLHVYGDGSETAYVWKIDWNDADNATEFYDGYEQVLAHWGAAHVETRGDAAVYEFDDDGPFDGALWVHHDGDRVTVANAPSVDDLGDVYEPAGG